MADVICTNCGSVEDYHIVPKANQQCAYCNTCGAFIKNISYAPQKFYFGKYKGKLVNEVDDIQYLEWFVANTSPKPTMKEVVENWINHLKGEKHGQ